MEPLPSEGSGRQIFLTALRLFSDSCNPPSELHAECPFSTETTRGRVCGEECSDLLEMHAATPKVGTVEITSALSAVPRPRGTRPKTHRPRMGPDLGSLPFDAKMIIDSERGLPLSKLSPTSLIDAVISKLSGKRNFEQLDSMIDLSLVHDLMKELDRRGIDSGALNAEIIYPHMAVSFAIQLIVLLTSGEGGNAKIFGRAKTEWFDIAQHLGIEDPASYLEAGDEEVASTKLVGIFLPEVVPRIHSWLNEQDLGDLEILCIPAPNVYMALEKASPFGGSVIAWIYERFCLTYIDGWSQKSLEREWRYVVDRELAPIEQSQMNFRRFDRDKLACEIASRAMSSSPRSRVGVMNSTQFVPKALELLNNRDYSAAATVFDVICQLEPDSSEAFNNRGFCRIPMDAESALKDFDRAVSLGLKRHEEPITVGNRMFCYLRLNRNTSALELAERWWGEHSLATAANDSWFCYMWSFGEDEAIVKEYKDSRVYVCDLARHIADGSGDTVASNLWALRESELKGV